MKRFGVLTIVILSLTLFRPFAGLAGDSLPDFSSSTLHKITSDNHSDSFSHQDSDSIHHPEGVTLDDFVLTASPALSVIPGQELRGEELRRLSALNVADAVRYFSGVQLKDYGGVGGVKTLDVRSMGSNHVGVFYDGVALGNAQNGQIDLGKYSLDNVEQISLFNGQKSDLFATARDLSSASALYIRTRRPQFSPQKRFNLRLRMRTGSFGLANPSLNFEWKFNRNLSAIVNAEYTHADGRYRFRYRGYYPNGQLAWDTTATRENGDVSALRLEAALFGRISHGDYMLKGYFYDSNRGIPGAIVNNVWKNSQRQWDRNLFFQGNLRRDLSGRVSLMANAKYARDYLRYLNPDTTQMYVDNKFWQDEAYASIASRIRLIESSTIDWAINAAADWQYNALESTLRNFVDPRRNTVMAALATQFSVGRLDMQANITSTSIFDSTLPYASDGSRGHEHNNRTALSGAFFANLQPLRSHPLRVRAFWKHSFRMPTFNDLYYTDIGNVQLRPEFVDQLNIGLTEALQFTSPIWRSLELRIDGYHNRIRDKIIAVPKGNSQYRWMMTNIGRVRVWGLDINAQTVIEPAPQLQIGLKLCYTFQRAMDYSNPADNDPIYGSYRGQISYIPRHSGSANLFANWRGFELNWSYLYVGERWHTSVNLPSNREAPWMTHDATLAYTRTFGATRWRLQLEVNNIFNHQYQIILNYPMPGRNFRIGLTFDY